MRKGRLPMCAVAGLCLAGTAGSVLGVTENPYTGIIDRNVFALKPPVVIAPVDPEANKPPPPKIIFTGLTTILGNKRVLLKAPVPAKPGEPAREESYIIAEGDGMDGINVLSIDEKAGTVKLSNHGNVVTLSLDKDGPKLPNSPAPAMPAMGIPGSHAPGLPVPPPMSVGSVSPTGLGTTPGTIAAYNSTGQRTIPTRNLRLPASGSVGSTGTIPTPGTPGYPVAGVTVAGAGGGGSVTLPGFTQVTPGITQSYTPPNVGSAEEQAILMEAVRQTDPMGAFLPPTRLNPGVNLQPTQPVQNPTTGQPGQQTYPNVPGGFPQPGMPPMPGFPPMPGR